MFFQRDNNVIWPIQNLSIVEPQHFEALAFEKLITALIMMPPFIRFVAITIDLDDDASGKPGKICNVRADRRFPSKSGATYTEVS